jgi:hypothetical protein
MRTHLVFGVLSGLFLVLGLIVAPAAAEIIEIQITGLNFSYDGSDIFDSVAKAGRNANISEADPLATIDFFKGGLWVGKLTTGDGIYADLLIDNVKNIKAGGSVVTGDGISSFGFDLLQNTGSATTSLLSLDINSLELYYSKSGVFITVGGTAASLVTQNLPFNLKISASDEIKLDISSSQLSNVTKSGEFVAGFDAIGTGDINGKCDTLVPEPAATTALAGLAAVGLLASFFRRRKMAA